MKTETKPAFIPLTFDGIFKALFRNKRYLIDFLKDVLKEEIKDLEYLDTYLEIESKNKKASFLDVLVKFNNGTYAIVEMQKSNEGSMITRMFYYLGKLATKSLNSGEEYKIIDKFIGICVLDYNDKNFPKLHNKCKLYNVDSKLVISDALEIHIINLQSKEINDKLRWMKVFKEGKKWDMGKYSDEELKLAVKELKRLSGDVEVMAAYDKEMKEKLDKALIKQAGIEQNKIETAINLYKNKVDKDTICKSLNISLEKLNKILKEN